MGNIVYINKDLAVRTAASEAVKFYGFVRQQIDEFQDFLCQKDDITPFVYAMLAKGVGAAVSYIKFEKDFLLDQLKSQAGSYAEELCQSPDIDLVLDASVVIMGDSANNMTEQFANYLIERNHDGLLVIDKQEIINSVQERIGFNSESFDTSGFVFKVTAE